MCVDVNVKLKMLIESKALISLLSLIVLLLSFLASFKRHSASIFVFGFTLCVLMNQFDVWVPHLRKWYADLEEVKQRISPPAVNSNNMPQIEEVKQVTHIKSDVIETPQPLPQMTPPSTTAVTEEKKTDETLKPFRKPKESMMNMTNHIISEETALRLISNNIGYAEKANQNRAVFAFGRPSMKEVMEGKGHIRDLVPNFHTFAHVMVGNLRLPNDPVMFKEDASIPQNPELLKLVPNGSVLVANKDFFPSCRNPLTDNNFGIASDPRAVSRCHAFARF